MITVSGSITVTTRVGSSTTSTKYDLASADFVFDRDIVKFTTKDGTTVEISQEAINDVADERPGFHAFRRSDDDREYKR